MFFITVKTFKKEYAFQKNNGRYQSEPASTLALLICKQSFFKAFGICSFNDYNVAETIEMSKDFVVPDMIPQFVQDIFVAKIAETRDAFKQKKTHSAEFKEFYLAELVGFLLL